MEVNFVTEYKQSREREQMRQECYDVANNPKIAREIELFKNGNQRLVFKSII